MNKEKTIVIVVGHPGVGKTTFCNLFAQIHKFKNINTGKCISEYLLMKKIKIGQKESWGEVFLQNFPPEYVYKVINKKIVDDSKFILDGLRLYSAYLKFKKEYQKVINVIIDAKEDIRSKRLFERSTNEGFEHDEARNISIAKDKFQIELNKLEKKANIIIDNSGSLDDLIRKIKSFPF
ncbi:MAG: AAA family ATPase [Chitinophagaceae bacterium]|nr:AAA family ATPase [Chitinophagaceae bacterium]